MRLDLYLVEKEYFTSRSKAALAIKEKKVRVNGNLITKAGFIVSENDVIEIKQDIYQFVSRGGYKYYMPYITLISICQINCLRYRRFNRWFY